MSGESPDEQLYGGDVNPGFGAGDRSLEILGQAAVSIEPSEGSFDDPSPWEQLKACRVSGAFDDFDGPVAGLDEGLAQVRAIINAVGEEAWPHRDLGHRRGAPRPRPADQKYRSQCGAYGPQPSLGQALDLLGRVVAARSTALGGLDRLTVDDPGRWARFTARRFPRLQQQLEIDLLKQAVVSPIVEITLHRRERRKVIRQHPPLTAGPRDIQNRVKHGSQLELERPAQRLGRRHMRLDQRPFRIRDIACVPLSLSLMLPPGDFGPHPVPR